MRPGRSSNRCRSRIAKTSRGVFRTSTRSIFRPYVATGTPEQSERDEILERSDRTRGSRGTIDLRGRSIAPARSAAGKAAAKRRDFEAARARPCIEHEDLFRRHFMAQPAALGSAKFAALHEAFVSSGTFVYVPRGVEVELPIEIFHWLHGENAAVFPHTLLIADELSKVTVIEHFRSAHPERAGFACGVNDLVVGRGAKINYVCAQNWNEKVLVDSDQRDHGGARRLRAEPECSSRRRLFALRKPEPPHRRRRPQRSPRGLGRQTARRNSTRAPCRITCVPTRPAISFTRMR